MTTEADAAPALHRTVKTTYEVVVIGRIGIDLYPLETAVPLGSVSSFGRFLGGSAANVAVAAARHGHTATLVSATGDDDFGRYLTEELERLGVSSRFVRRIAALPTPLAFCELYPPDHFPITFYMGSQAPYMALEVEHLDLDSIADADLFWMTATGFAQEPSRDAHWAALAAREAAPSVTVLDLDHREGFWDSNESFRQHAVRAISQVDVVVGNLTECELALGESDPVRAAQAILDLGPTTAIVKLGPDGVLGARAGETDFVPPFRVDVVNGLGAGDGFGGALCHGLLEEWPLRRLLEFANTAGAIVASRLECAAAMPTTAEVVAAMKGEPVESRS